MATEGYAEGGNVAIVCRFADGRYDALRSLAEDLVRQGTSVILTSGGSPTVLAAKSVTPSSPIVFVSGTDPVTDGLVASLAHPGGNLTGVMLMITVLQAKLLELLHDLLPNVSAVAILSNPLFPPTEETLKTVEAAAPRFNVRLVVSEARNLGEIDAALAAIAQRRPDALFVGTEPFLNSAVGLIAARAGRPARRGRPERGSRACGAIAFQARPK